jgi:hypothetical protein
VDFLRPDYGKVQKIGQGAIQNFAVVGEARSEFFSYPDLAVFIFL